MSYLTTPELKSFDKAVISFWFKVSQKALDAAQKEYDDFWNAWTPDQNPPPLLGLVPLVVFGKEGTSRASAEPHNVSTPLTTSTTVTTCVEQASFRVDGDAAIPGTTLTMTYRSECETRVDTREYSKDTVTYSTVPGKPLNPSFIAIDGRGRLQINFESTQTGDVTLAYDIVSVIAEHYTQEMVNECFTFQHLPGCGDFVETVVSVGGLAGALQFVFAIIEFRLNTAVADKYIDQGSSPRVEHPEVRTYGPVPGDVGTGAINFSPTGLDADTWHHVLVSVDMSGGSASTGIPVGGSYDFEEKRITKTSTLYVAVDDVNYPTGGNLFPDTNKVVTAGAVAIAFTSQAPQGPVPSYSLTNMKVPSAPVGIPSVGKYKDKIHKVQMAELLFFTGVTLDTSKEENRRHFITKPDKQNFQHPTNQSLLYIPTRKFAIGDPATWEPGADNPAWAPPLFDPSASPTGIKIEDTGKTADIDFTKCQWNWQMGRNLGSLEGKVEKTGRIRALVPPQDEQPRIKAAGG